ncbi:putative siderophore biosynthesis protein SbnA [compost metagenome]
MQAHYYTTGPEILKYFPAVDYLFIGAGTTGTLGGVSKYFRERSPKTKIIAVDSVGSVTFGKPSGKRLIPGLGTSTPPPIHKHSDFDELLRIDEADTVNMCLQLGERGMLFGGSTGTVLCGVQHYAPRIKKDACVVAISPDMGDRYINMMYCNDWVTEHFPLLSSPADHSVSEKQPLFGV